VSRTTYVMEKALYSEPDVARASLNGAVEQVLGAEYGDLDLDWQPDRALRGHWWALFDPRDFEGEEGRLLAGLRETYGLRAWSSEHDAGVRLLVVGPS